MNSSFGVLDNLSVNISTYLAKQQGRQRRLLSSDLRVTSSQGVTLSSAVVRCCSTSNQLCKINIKTKILHVFMCIHFRHCLNKTSF